MRDGLNATGRNIIFSFEPHNTIPTTWQPYVGNAWRTGHDIGAHYESMFSDLTINNAWANVGGPGSWNDGDMLEVGNHGLSVPEARSHFALWCLVKSPLLIGCDLTKIAPPYLQILLNKELIAISQDPLGKQGKLVAASKSATTGYTLPKLTKEQRSRLPPAVGAARRPGRGQGANRSMYDAFQMITDCAYVPGTIEPVQQWSLNANSTITTTQTGGGCLAVSNASAAAGMEQTAVVLQKCDGSVTQQWSGFAAVQKTVAGIVSAIKPSSTKEAPPTPMCLATDGASLFVEPCLVEPDRCNGCRCTSSVRVQQLWYAAHSGQVISSYTNTKIPPLTATAKGVEVGGLCDAAVVPGHEEEEEDTDPFPIINPPKCIATQANANPPQPPQPPPDVSAELPLQVWAGELSGGRFAVILVNADAAPATIDAHFSDIGQCTRTCTCTPAPRTHIPHCACGDTSGYAQFRHHTGEPAAHRPCSPLEPS